MRSSVRRSHEGRFSAVIIGSGRSVARLARLLGVQEVAGSNPAAPTSSITLQTQVKVTALVGGLTKVFLVGGALAGGNF